MNQAEKIQKAVLRSLHSRDLYTERQVHTMLNILNKAETHVKSQLVEIGQKKIIPKGLEVRREQLRGIQTGIDAIIRDMRNEQTVIMKTAIKDSFKSISYSKISISYTGNILS